MNDEAKGFLSRWSQRKVQVRQGVAPAPAPAPAAAVRPLPVAPAAAGGDVGPASGSLLPADTATARVPPASAAQAPAADPARPPPPTLEDVQALTPESDFSRFMARDVDTQVKNSAMKKLFADPHYNVMDRLDTYIDDYNTPDPIPSAMFKQLVQARMLGLLDDELEDQVPSVAGAVASEPPQAPQGPTEAHADNEPQSDAEVSDPLLNACPMQAQPLPPAMPVADLSPPLGAAPDPGPDASPLSPLKAV